MKNKIIKKYDAVITLKGDNVKVGDAVQYEDENLNLILELPGVKKTQVKLFKHGKGKETKNSATK